VTKKLDETETDNLFRATVGKVRAIDTNTVILKPEQKPRPIPAPKLLEAVDPLQKEVLDTLETLYQEDKVAFITPGLQKSVLKKLRKGYFGLDADIDLHGLNSRDALQQLIRFLHYCVEDGKRCALVVHGKGYHSPDNQPVLKNDINLWLRQHKDVLAFCSAPSKVGGTGALLVLLRLSDKYDVNEEDI
jgi:DNA-nicking Smr family endonuclease